ncbi:MAG: phosphotransferase [Acidimicrobiia bacterium]|nr:phosphotransferase [Acidimicrobiia bacterium]
MRATEGARAVAAAGAVGTSLGLAVDDVIVLQDSTRLALRLLPCDVLARVALVEPRSPQFELDLAQQLTAVGAPVGTLEPRVEPCVYEHDGFTVTLWTFYEPTSRREHAPGEYVAALERLHAGLREIDLATPHFTDRVDDALQLVTSPALTPALREADRTLLVDTLRSRTRAIGDRRAAEQRLHGEPHPGNLLPARHGLLFIDLETCCRGPVEFDLSYVPAPVSERYPGVDEDLLCDCRVLSLAMVAAWRWDVRDDFPDGERAGHELVRALREGPPWPTLDDVMP